MRQPFEILPLFRCERHEARMVAEECRRLACGRRASRPSVKRDKNRKVLRHENHAEARTPRRRERDARTPCGTLRL
jgi:hypothetical protein